MHISLNSVWSDRISQIVLIAVNDSRAHVAIAREDGTFWTFCYRSMKHKAKEVSETNIQLCQRCRRELAEELGYLNDQIAAAKRFLEAAEDARQLAEALLAEPETPFEGVAEYERSRG